MGKNYEVEFVAYSTVVVMNAEDEDEAMELAREEIRFSSAWDEDRATAREIGDDELDSCRRHANEVVEDDSPEPPAKEGGR